MSTLFRLDAKEVQESLTVAFNPPRFSSGFSEDDFNKEYWETHKSLKAVLNELGYKDSGSVERGMADYVINEDFSLSRFVGIEMVSRRMIARKTIESISSFLNSLNERYMVFLTCDFADSMELFFVVVTADQAVGQFEMVKTAADFGFDPASGYIGPIV